MRKFPLKPATFWQKVACFFGSHPEEDWVYHTDNHSCTSRRWGQVQCLYCGHVRTIYHR